MTSKHKPSTKRRRDLRKQNRKVSKGIGGHQRFEQLEDRMLLTVDFVPLPLGDPTPNRPDRALGLSAPTTQPAIALNPNDPGLISVANESQLLVSTNAGNTFNAAGTFQGLLGSSATANGSADLVYTSDGELKWSEIQTATNDGTQSIGVTFSQSAPAVFGVTTVPTNVAATVSRPVIAADTNEAADTPYAGYLYVSFTDTNANTVMLSRSADGGLNWSTPVAVSSPNETTTGTFEPVTSSSISVGPNGDVYVAYHYQPSSTEVQGADNQSNSDGLTGQVFVRRSTDGGLSFVSKTTAFEPGQADVSFNVQTALNPVPNARFSTEPGRQPTVLADPVREGHVYVVANDDPDNIHGFGDEGNIVFARSDDFGQTWDRRTIDLSGSFQIMPQAEIDEFGNIILAWYDSALGQLQGDIDNRLHVFSTYSVDGGSTWSAPIQITDSNNPIDPVTPNTAIIFGGADIDNDNRIEDDGDETYSLGNYFDIEAFGGTAYIVWNGNERTIGLPSAHQVFYDVYPIYGTLKVTGFDTDDTFLVRAMADNPQYIEVIVNGQREYAGLMESLKGGIQFDGMAGNDTLIVDYESTNANPVPTGGIFFQGNTPEGGQDVGDTLNILSGDRTLNFQNETSDLDAGLFVVGDSAAISFDSVERTQVGSVNYLRPDALEPNDSFLDATVLGSEATVALRNLTIHDVGEAQSNDDFYKITAHHTGMMVINALFDSTDGNLSVNILDTQGVAVGTGQTGSRIVIPVVTQETYTVQISGNNGDINQYALEIENFPTPAPLAVFIDASDDSGMMNNDAITAEVSPRVTIQADLTSLSSQGIALLTQAQAESGDQSGAAIFVDVQDAVTGAELESGYASPLGGDLYEYLTTDLPDGNIIVSASVHIFDPSTTDRAVGPSLNSSAISLVIDTESPTTTSPQLLGSSDSGMDSQDQVTNIMSPAFVGVTEPNAKVRVLANGSIVGETVAGTDGRWEITVEPLTEGIYDFTTQVQDLAGNFGESDAINRVEVDKTAPNTPYLDLTAGSDTGLSDSDNVTGDNTLTFTMTTTDMGDHLNQFNFKYRLYARPQEGAEILIYDSTQDTSIPAANLDGMLTDLTLLTTTTAELPDGVHNFKLEVEDRAGNISEDFLLDVTIDTSLPGPLTLDLLDASDTGMDNTDNVTYFTRPTFTGTGAVGAAVTLFADGQLVGTGSVAGDASDGVDGNGLGAWEITSGSLDDGIYEITAVTQTNAGSSTSESLTVEIDTLQPNTPLLDLIPSSDAGHSDHDNITSTINPVFNMATEDPNQDQHGNEFNNKFRLYVRLDSGPEELVYDSVGDPEFPNSATDGVFTNLENIRRTLSRGLPDGVHNFKLEVEDRAGNISEDFLLDIQIDTTLVTSADGVTLDLITTADTGMDGRDNTTKINTPTFVGVGEVGAEVSLYADGVLVGTTTVGSDDTDFNSADGLGAWEISSDALGDGQHNMLVHIEDWAGNFIRSEPLTIDVDTTPPNTPFLDLVGGNSIGLGSEVSISADLAFTMTTEDPDLDDRANPFNYKFRIFQRAEGLAEVLVYDSVTDSDIPTANRQGGFTDLNFLQTVVEDLPNGQHNFKLEVEDRAGNISTDFLLSVVRVVPNALDALTIDLLNSSDTGMSENDDVTNKDQPAFNGIATIGTQVRLRTENGDIIGTTTVGGDASNGILGDGLGTWEITSEPLDDDVYTVFAEVEDDFGNTVNTDTITFEVDTIAPNTPQLDLLPEDDSGLSNRDNVTNNLLPSFNMATLDSNKDNHINAFNFKYRLFVRLDSGVERLVYNSAEDNTFPASAFQDGFTSLENLRREIDLGIPDGVHNFKVEVEDRAGNISVDTLLNVTIDTVLDAPEAGISIDLASISDTGMSDRDNVTNINRPTLTGIAEVGAIVTLVADGQVVGTGVVGSDETDFSPNDGLGVWEIQVDTLDDGQYNLLAHVEDLAGNFLRSDELTIEIDTTQPNTPYLDLLNDTGHANYDNITEDSSLNFNFTTTDAALPNGADRMSDFNLKFRIYVRPETGEELLVYNSVTDQGIETANIFEGFTDLNQLQSTLGPFPDGIHNFKLEVEDRAGNISEDFLLTVQIDSNLEGDPGIDMLDSSDTGMDENDNVTRIDQPAFDGVAEVGSTVRLFANGRMVGVAEVQSDASDGTPGDGLGLWEITSEPLDDGVYNIRADLEDWAGNIESTGVLQIEVDTLQPNTPLLDLIPMSDSGLSESDNVTNVVVPTFNMATIDPNADDHLSTFNYKYRIFVRHDSGVELLLYNSVDDTTFTPSSLQNGFTSLENLRRAIELGVPDGVHNFKLEVEDRAGNISEDFLLDIKIDTVLEAPDEVITIDMLATSDTGMNDADNVTNKDQPAFSGIAEVGAMVTLLSNGRVIGTAVVGSDETDLVSGDGYGAWEVTVEPLADGIHSITAHVEDLAGNFLRSDELMIEVDTRAPNTPFLDLVSESDTGLDGRDEVTNDNTLTFNMTTTDAAVEGHMIDENYKFRLYVRPENGGEILVYDSVTDDELPPEAFVDGLIDVEFLQRTLGELPDGKHNFKLEVEDRAGNISDDFLLNVTIDTSLVAPTINLIDSSDSGMSGTDNVTRIDAPTFAGTGDVGNRVTIYADGIIVGTGFVGSDLTDFIEGDGRGAWEITIDPLDDGVYGVIAHIEDDAGNFERTSPLNFEVDTFEPNTPHLDLVTTSDTGHSPHDNITGDTTPTFTFTTEDPNASQHLNEFNYKYRLFLRPEGGEEVLIYDSVVDPTIDIENLQNGFVNLEFIETTMPTLPDGIHNFKLEVEDRAGNISTDVVLTVEIDSSLPDVGQIDMLEASDSGMSATDNVTNKDQPAFSGLGTAGTLVRLLANGELVGSTEVGSDESDGIPGNGLGVWEITSEPLDDGAYTMNATFEDWAGNISTSGSLQIEVDTIQPNTPFLDLLESDDSGRHDDDNITNASIISFSATTEDTNAADHAILFPGGHNLKYRIFVRPESGEEQLVYDSVTDTSLTNKQGGFISLNQITAEMPNLPDGLHNFKLEVEDRAGNISEDFLMNVLIDRVAFQGTVAIHPDSDTGIWGIDSTFGDGITGNSTPTFTGTGEANNIVTVFIDGEQVGQTVVTPFDGDDAFTTGTWEITSNVSLNDGIHTANVIFEDPAGNRTDGLDLPFELAIDTTGPSITNVTRADLNFTSIFDPKPAGGPDPLISSIVVHFADAPSRTESVQYDAVLEQLAVEEGNYRLIGDANGNIPIVDVQILNSNDGPGIATTAVQLFFAGPLPDDRFTFTVYDRIADAAGNPLDGDSGANGPFAGNDGISTTSPIFPTGDGNHGGDFISRFTIDSRPEVGVWAAGSVYIDTNGNFSFDPTNTDFSNRDITYAVGFTSDDIFAGNFAGPNDDTDGYDKLAAYGRYGGWEDGTFRWLVDLDNDGVVDIDVEDPADINGLPVSGNFDGDAQNGDEVALFTGTTWHFDTNGDYLVDLALPSELRGYPAIGDFDGDGHEDLATWADDTYMIDLANGVSNGWDGVADATFRFGFIGVRERPVSADMDQDGFDDLGLWVPDRGGSTPRETGEWYWLVSGGDSILDRIVSSTDPVLGTTQEIQFRPVPFGNDIFAQFGDEFGIPIVGNFDPPTLGGSVATRVHSNPVNPLDVNNDGFVSPRDVLTLITHANEFGFSSVDDIADDVGHYLDTSNDGFFSPADALAVIRHLNNLDDAGSGEPDGFDALAADVAAAQFETDNDDDDERDPFAV